MKKFLSLCLASLMILASASTVLADDGIMLISETEAVPDQIVIDDVKEPKTAPVYAYGGAIVFDPDFDYPNNGDNEKLRMVNPDYPNGQYPEFMRAPFGFFPHQVTIKVEAGENGSVDVPAKFFAAVSSSRTFNITPDEGYEVADITVNGVSYGPAYSVKLKNIKTAMDIKVTFAEEVKKPVGIANSYVCAVDGGVLYAGDVEWTSGGTAEAIVVGDKTMSVVSTGGDPNITGKGFNMDTVLVDQIIVRFKNNTENTKFQIFFTTDTTPNFCEEASFVAEVVANGDNDVVIEVAEYANELWTGKLVDMRIDLSNGVGSFDVESVEFVNYIWENEVAVEY